MISKCQILKLLRFQLRCSSKNLIASLGVCIESVKKILSICYNCLDIEILPGEMVTTLCICVGVIHAFTFKWTNMQTSTWKI